MSVHDGSGVFVGRDYYSDARPSYFMLLNLELREECSGWNPAGAASGYGMHAIGEQQSKRTQSGEQQLKRTQSGEQQLKRTQSGSSS